MLNRTQAVTLKLLEEESLDVPSTVMLQSLARFLLESMVQDFRSVTPYSIELDQVGNHLLLAAITRTDSSKTELYKTLALKTIEVLRCLTCRGEHSRKVPITISDLMYPATVFCLPGFLE